MKRPSLAHAADAARATAVRFPLILADAALAAFCAVVLIEPQHPAAPSMLLPILYGSVFGVPLLAALAITSEKWMLSRTVSLGIQALGIVIAGVYALTVPQDLSGAPAFHHIRLFMLTLAAFLFAFSAPFIGHENELGFWNYLRVLLQRIIIAGVYAFVLWAGLAIALAALDHLFGVTIPPQRYAQLWVLINGTFSAWFVMAGVPEDLYRLDDVTDYPNELTTFAQYILFPLISLYAVILYAYMGRILFSWSWPEGWVSRLILGFLAAGFTSFILTAPIRQRLGNASWITRASTWFYRVIIPLIVLLLLAVWQRVSEYGITEGRYIGLATVVWLCVVTPYYLFSRTKKILVLPLSLCVFTLVVSIGPWSMFSISERSQVDRLKTLLVSTHILVDGRVQTAHDAPDVKSTQEISSILTYLSELHGFDRIQPWFAEDLQHVRDGRDGIVHDPARVASLLGVKFVRTWRASSDEPVTLRADRSAALEIGGYQRMLRSQRLSADMEHREFADRHLRLRIPQEMTTMNLAFGDGQDVVDSLSIDLKPLVEKLMAEYGSGSTDNIPPEKMAITAAGEKASVKVFLSTLRLQPRLGKESGVASFDAEIAYTIK